MEFCELLKIDFSKVFVVKVSLLFCKRECMVGFEDSEMLVSRLLGEISENYGFFMLLLFFIVLLCIIYENVYMMNYLFYL